MTYIYLIVTMIMILKCVVFLYGNPMLQTLLFSYFSSSDASRVKGQTSSSGQGEWKS